MTASFRRIFIMTAAFISVVLLVSMANAEDKPENNPDEKAKQSMLKREAEWY